MRKNERIKRVGEGEEGGREGGVTSEAVVSLVFTKAAAEISPSFHFLIIVLIFGNFPPK